MTEPQTQAPSREHLYCDHAGCSWSIEYPPGGVIAALEQYDQHVKAEHDDR